MSGQSPRRVTPRTPRQWTLWFTNVFVKLPGAILALHEGFTRRDPVTMGVAALMIAGGQFSEEVILGILDRIFRPPEESAEPDEQERGLPHPATSEETR